MSTMKLWLQLIIAHSRDYCTHASQCLHVSNHILIIISSQLHMYIPWGVTCVCVCVYMHVHMCTCVYMCMCTCVRVCVLVFGTVSLSWSSSEHLVLFCYNYDLNRSMPHMYTLLGLPTLVYNGSMKSRAPSYNLSSRGHSYILVYRHVYSTHKVLTCIAV